jgi:hypothetical protein
MESVDPGKSAATNRPTRARLRGYPSNRWPRWFNPTPLDLQPTPLAPFPQSLRLTADGDVTAVPLPGHSPGHVGVIVEDGNHTVFLAGDSSYTQELMHSASRSERSERARVPLYRSLSLPRLTATATGVQPISHRPSVRERTELDSMSSIGPFLTNRSHSACADGRLPRAVLSDQCLVDPSY